MTTTFIALAGNDGDDTISGEEANSQEVEIPRNYLYNPYWIDMKMFGRNDIYYLNTKEITFWQGLIDKYLHPLNKNEIEENRITKDLKELRNNSCFAFFMLNALWIVMQFQFEYVSVAFPKLQVPIGRLYNRPDQKVQILGVVFLILFTLVLFLQFLSMLFHRWGTIIEILASTRLFSKHHKYRDTKLTIQEAVDLIKEMELEKQDMNQLFFSETGNSTSNMTSEYDTNFAEPDPDYDEDILPEPEPDYFDHPAVNNETNWNEPLRAMSPAQRHHQNQFNLNMSNSYNNRDMFMSPSMRYLQPNDPQGMQNGGGGQNGGKNGSFAYSPRQHAFKPLQSLDVRVMRQFRALEQKDPRFKRRVQQIQYMSGRLNSPASGNADAAGYVWFYEI